jgi:hypothetical protein
VGCGGKAAPVNADLRDDEVQLRAAIQQWVETALRLTGKAPDAVVIATVVGSVRVTPLGEAVSGDDASVRFQLLELE